jgi:protein-L-isoaspartate(D-aspartate) O-methyltransferase
MSWRSGGSTNGELINNLFRNKLIKSQFIRNAMEKVDRRCYLKMPETFPHAYDDRPLPLNDQVTISAPHMHAMAMEYLSDQFLKPNCMCLDVGSGSGYLVACMVQALREVHPINELKKPCVIGIEYLKELVDHSKEALKKDLDRASNGDKEIHALYEIRHGDGWDGVPEFAPYNAIHVGAAAASLPEKLVQQLAIGGRMVIPIGPQWGEQNLCLVDKKEDGSVHVSKVCGVAYVPLVNPKHQR